MRKTKKAVDAGSPEPGANYIRYADYLSDQIANHPKPTKGARTKDALKLAAIRLLDDVGYHAMRVTDISEAAELGTATFYLYFKNKPDITLEVLTEFLARASAVVAPPDKTATAFDAIRSSNLRWMQMMRANAGLMRCTLQIGDEEQSFREVINRSNLLWYERIAQSIQRNHPEGALTSDVALLSAYALGSMMDELARKITVYPDPILNDLIGRTTPGDGELADFLAVLWYQALYGVPPKAKELGAAARQIAAARAAD